MKKLLAMILAVAMLSTLLGACTKLEAPASTTAAAPPAAATTAAGTSAAATTATEIAPMTFKVGFVSAQALTDQAHAMICDEIESLSGGKIKTERYLQGQLYGSDADGAVALSEGAIEMVIMGDLLVAAAAPEIAGFSFIPFAFDDENHCARFWDAVSDKANDKILDKYGARMLTKTLELRGPRMLCSNKPIYKAEDFKGLKMRLPSIAATVAAFEALGANTMTSAWAEVYGLFQTKTCDATDSPVSTFNSISIFEVAKYAILSNHQYSFRAAHVNEKWWSGLSKAQQDIIYAGIKKGFEWFNEQEFSSIDPTVETWKSKGMTVITADQLDLESIKNTATQTILEKYKNEWDMSAWDTLQSVRNK